MSSSPSILANGPPQAEQILAARLLASKRLVQFHERVRIILDHTAHATNGARLNQVNTPIVG
jgi:hypothetical protein